MSLIVLISDIVNSHGDANISLDNVAGGFVAGAREILLSGEGVGDFKKIKADDFDKTADEVDLVVDLSTFSSDFELDLKDERAADTLTLKGADEVVVSNNNGTRTVTFTGADGATHEVTIKATVASVEVARDGGVEIGPGVGLDNIEGGDGGDTISGGAGHDTISGGAGDDNIISGVDENDLGGSGERSYDFPLIRLGQAADVDVNENDGRSENAEDLLGTYGGDDNPLSGSIVFAVSNDLNQDDNLDDNDNGRTAETFTINGEDLALDSVQVYNAQVEFVDGTTGNFTAVVIQLENGEFFLAPEPMQNADSALLTSGEIKSITLEDLIVDDTNLYGLRLDTAYVVGDDDIVDGGSGDDTIQAGIGDDFVEGGIGADQVFGGAGGDTLEGGSGDDTIYGGSGEDYLRTGVGDDVLYGGAGDDTLKNSAGDDQLFGGSGNDSLVADQGADTIFGGLGRDTLIGGSGDDFLDGGDGTDQLFGGSGDDRLLAGFDDGSGDGFFGGQGIDTYQIGGSTVENFSFNVNLATESDTFGNQLSSIENVIGGNAADTIIGSSVSNQLEGGGGADSIVGAAGDDSLDGASGSDSVFGGSGDDTVSGGQGADTIEGGIGADTAFAGSGDDSVSGGSGDDQLFGNSGADTVFGGAGADIIITEAGADSVVGGSGDDLIFGGSGDDSLRGVVGDVSIYGGAGADSIFGVEGLGGSIGSAILYGGSGDDTIQTAGDNTISTANQILLADGGEGDDSIILGADDQGEQAFGGSGNDTITSVAKGSFGSTQLSDTINGGAGADSISAGNQDDIVTGGSGDDTINAGSGDDVVTGDEGADNIFGGLGSDTISGGAGSDTLFGGAGDDSLTTGSGNDALFGGSGDDTLRNSSGDDSLVGGSGDDSIVASVGADTLEGGAGADTLIGGSGDDSLVGESGDDIITGSSGDDQAFGGADQDAFLFTDGFGNDTIEGGEDGTDLDTLDLSSLSGPITVSYSGEESGTASDGSGSIAFSEIETILGVFDVDGVSDVKFVGNPNLTAQTGTQELNGITNQFKLDGDATDSISGNNGVVNGAATISGKDGDALSFDEVDDYVEIPDVTMNNEFTVTFQFKVDDNSGSLFQYVYSHGNINDTNSLNIFINEDTHGTDPNVLRTVIRDNDDTLNNTALEFDVNGIIGDGEWHTYTLTVEDGVGSKVYLDGALQNSDTRGGDGFNPSGNLFLGAREDLNADRYFGGELDTVQIYDRPLSPEEAVVIHNSEGDFIQAGTVVASVNDVIDADNPTGHVFALTDDANGKFTIDPSTGAISLVANHDASSVFSDTVAVEVTDPDLATFTTTLGVTIGREGVNDTLSGPHTQNVIYGLDGDDSLTGASGRDAIFGGSGDDNLSGGSGDDTLDGGSGDDALTGGEGFDTFVISSGNDTISDFGTATGQVLNDGDQTNNDFVDLSAFYDNISEVRGDFDDDGVLNQSNATDDKGRATDFSDNTAMSGGTRFSGVSSSDEFTQDTTDVVCFAEGTMITTPAGDVPVECLSAGDLVETMDHEAQPIAWIGQQTISAKHSACHDNLKPIRIEAGALGSGLPRKDLFVSQQHRMLVSGPIAKRMFDDFEVLMPAKALLGAPGVSTVEIREDFNLVHFMFENHEIVFADGAPSETFFPGPMALRTLQPKEREAVLNCFLRWGRIERPAFYPARRFVKVSPGRSLIARHVENGKPLLRSEHLLPAFSSLGRGVHQ